MTSARNVRAFTAATLTVGAMFFASRDACAQAVHELQCPLPAHASSALGSHDARTRFRFVRSTMGDQARRALSWSMGWSFFGVAAAGETTALAIASHDEKRRIIWLANGLPALGFPGLILIDPLQVMADDREVRALALNDPLEEKLCQNLARAEQLFAEDAADEAKKTGFFSHALCVLANVASSAVIVIGTGDWTSAILNGVSGEAVSEVNLYTLPTGAVSALEKYRAGDLAIPSGMRTVGARGLSFSFTW